MNKQRSPWRVALRMGACASIGLPLALAQAQAQACEVVPLLEPAAGAWVNPQQAVLRWQARPTNAYRLQLRIIRPEGPTLQTIDLALNETQWRLTKPPASDKASVQVRVTVGCSGDGMDELLAQPPAFFIRQATACRVDAASLRQQGTGLSWAAVAGANTYRVRLAPSPRIGLPAIDDSPAWLPSKLQVVHEASVAEPQIALPSAALRPTTGAGQAEATPLMAIVQAQCGTQSGPPATTLLLSQAQP